MKFTSNTDAITFAKLTGAKVRLFFGDTHTGVIDYSRSNLPAGRIAGSRQGTERHVLIPQGHDTAVAFQTSDVIGVLIGPEDWLWKNDSLKMGCWSYKSFSDENHIILCDNEMISHVSNIQQAERIIAWNQAQILA